MNRRKVTVFFRPTLLFINNQNPNSKLPGTEVQSQRRKCKVTHKFKVFASLVNQKSEETKVIGLEYDDYGRCNKIIIMLYLLIWLYFEILNLID